LHECPINNLPAAWPSCTNLWVEGRAVSCDYSTSKTTLNASPARREYGIPFPVLKDEGNVVATCSRTTNPEAFIWMAKQDTLQGRIDDQFGNGFRRARPTERLINALDEVLAARRFRPTTAVAGCIIGAGCKGRSGGS